MKPTKTFRTIEVSDDLPAEEVVVPDLKPTMVTRQFIFAGRAFFRVVNPQGHRMVYKVHMRDGLGDYRGQKSFFVRVQSNKGMQPFQPIGVLLADGTLKVVGRSQFIQGTPEFDVAQWAFRVIIDGLGVPEGYKIEHIGKCGVCGQTLTGVEIHLGFHEGCTNAVAR